MTVDIGSYFPDRDQPPLAPEEHDVVDRFHDLYYRRWFAGADTINLSWFGHQVLKCPLDLWMYQELLVRTRPDVVVETGTHHGGSACFMAMIMDQIGHGSIVSVDIDDVPSRPVHPRITYLTGSSVDPAMVADVHARVAGGRAIVILDSDHSAAHVLAEIGAYGQLVGVGDHLIVEDTNVNGHPTFPEFGPGPMEAVDEFLAASDEFVVDERCERFMMTLNPKGYLKRVKPAPTAGW
ncbi:MAG: Cephalosporin hydroxylase [Solirubrobacterales bacterium]|nr:Cephalosporin hydroxylase [Solirubrobacterales bacterium]